MIFFGWGHQTTKNYGVTFKNLCSNCNNEEYWILSRILTWFTLYFIPVIPYEFQYFLSCPICKYRLVLNKKQISEIRPLAEANQLLINGDITEIEHRSRLGLTENDNQQKIEQPPSQDKNIVSRDVKLQYCAECGQGITPSIKFCGSCGIKITPT